MDFVPGAMIGGKYRLERKIAEGGMGEVWIAVHGPREKNTRVAIKRLLADVAKDREIVTRFRREALLLGKLQSDHVSRVVEQVNDPDFGELLVMEYVEGDSLADMLDKRKVLPVEEVLELALDLTRAVSDLHRANIVHRDLKPENVILKRAGKERRAVLIDFGLARLLNAGDEKSAGEETLTGITRAETAVGTIAYMAPEQLLSSRDVSRAADVYAIGAILYRAASGRLVFGDVDDMSYARQKLNDEAPPLALSRKDTVAASLERIIMRAVKRRPVERYEGMEPMDKDLAQAHAARPAPDADAPTQAAPISSLLGSAAAELAETVRPPKPTAAEMAATLRPGQTQSPGLPPGMALAPTMAQPPASHTVPIMSTTGASNLSPLAFPMGAPPVPPSFGRPPTAAGQELVGAAALRAPTISGPRAPAGDLAGFGAPPSDMVPRRVAIVGAVVALVLGFGVGLGVYAAASGPAEPDCPPAATGKTTGR